MNEASLIDILKELGIRPKQKTRRGWLMAGCPFAPFGGHKNKIDRNASFGCSVNLKGMSGFNCLTCKQTGTIAQLVTKLEAYRGESYGTLNTKAMLAEMKVDYGDFADSQKEEYVEYEPIDESSTSMFPNAWDDEYGRAYLEGRGIDEATARLIPLRYDPDDWRIVFDIRGMRGELYGFTGRTILEEDQYPTSRYSRLHNYADILKSHFLLGIEHYQEGLPVIVVEGLFAYAALIKEGVLDFANVVATMGSDMSPIQARMLVEMNEDTYLLYDNDLAGDTGLYGPMNKEGTAHKGGGAVDLLKGQVPLYIPSWPRWVEPSPCGKWQAGDPKEDPDQLVRDEVWDFLTNTSIMV